MKVNFKTAVKIFGKENESSLENLFEQSGWDKEKGASINLLFDYYKEKVMMDFILYEE